MSEYGSIVFLSRDWLPVALGVAALVILVSLWGYGRARLPMRLKLAGITGAGGLAGGARREFPDPPLHIRHAAVDDRRF